MPRKIDIVPFAENDLSADYLFEQRTYYVSSSDVYPQEDRYKKDLPKPVDMWYNKPYWGKVDTRQRLVLPSPGSLSLLTVESNLSTLNFVSDAYISFRNYAVDAASKLRTSMTSFIDIENPKKAYQDSVLDYKEYFENTLEPGFINTFLSEADKSNIDDFMDYLDEYLLFVKSNPEIPHTLAGYISSPFVSYRSSGMIIEFSYDDYDRDSNKWNKFLSNDFFYDYVKIASYYGFYVSKHVPWAIVANLNSKYMKDYMVRYNVSNMLDNFNLNFLQAEYISFESFKKYMFIAYASFLRHRPRKEEIIYKNCIKNKLSDSSFRTEREIKFRTFEINYFYPDYELFTSLYSDVFFLEAYTKIRLKEEKVTLDQRAYETLLLRLFKTSGDIYNKLLTLSEFLAHHRKNKFNKLTRKTNSDSISQEYTPPSSYFSKSGIINSGY